MLKRTGLIAMTLVLAANLATADLMAPTSADASSTRTKLPEKSPEKTIDGSGLTGDEHINNANSDDGCMWLNEPTLDEDGRWIKYAFESSTPLEFSGVQIWNYNHAGAGNTNYGIAVMNLLYTTSADPLAASAVWVPLDTNMAVTKANGLATYTGEYYDFPESVVATGFMFEILSDQSGGASGYVGVSEVRFDGTEVPEPATLAVLAAGGLVLLRSRRRRNAA